MGRATTSWFRTNLFDTYHNGLEFLLGIDDIAFDAEENWAPVPRSRKLDLSGFKVGRGYFIGRVPYRNIVDIDIDGDEYFQEPHLYCRFAEAGQPYEAFVHRSISETYPAHLPEERRRTLERILRAVNNDSVDLAAKKGSTAAEKGGAKNRGKRKRSPSRASE